MFFRICRRLLLASSLISSSERIHLRISVVRGVSGSSASNIPSRESTRESPRSLLEYAFTRLVFSSRLQMASSSPIPRELPISQTLQRTTHILHTSERNVPFLEETGECIFRLSLHMTDLINICRRFSLFADFLSHGGRSLVCQHIDDLIVFKCFILLSDSLLFKSPDYYF